MIPLSRIVGKLKLDNKASKFIAIADEDSDRTRATNEELLKLASTSAQLRPLNGELGHAKSPSLYYKSIRSCEEHAT